MKRILYIILLICLIACSDQKAIIIDEKISSQEAFKKLNKEEIYSDSEWQAGSVPHKYEEFSDKGVIIIITKAYNKILEEARHALLNQKIAESKEANFKGKLFIYNGIEVPTNQIMKLTQLKPDELSAVEILSLKAAQVIYQDKAQDENILINTKEVNNTDLIEKE